MEHSAEAILPRLSNTEELFMYITHEMKTPLSVILGAINLIELNPACHNGTRLETDVKIAKHNCYRLMRLLNNLQDMNKISSTGHHLNKYISNIVSFVNGLVQSVRPYANEKEQTLEFISETDEIWVEYDSEKIERVLLNLISNAIKFTPHKGKITVGIKSDSSHAILHVSDTGPGIPEEKQTSIFERFMHVSSPYTRENEGTGLGLYLVKKFVGLHNGEIKVNSREDNGSEFVIKLPLAKKSLESKIDDQKIKYIKYNTYIELSDIG